VDDDPSQTPAWCQPSLRDGSDDETGGVTADRRVGGKDSTVKLALNVNVGSCGTRSCHAPCHASINWKDGGNRVSTQAMPSGVKN
jgi:hypothetical protein